MKLCKRKTKDGRQCHGPAMKGSQYCYWHSKGGTVAKQPKRQKVDGSKPIRRMPSQTVQTTGAVQRLDEKYRPHRFKDVVGQDTVVRKVQAVLNRGWGGRAFWFSGESGTGKTTLARIIAEMGTWDVDAGDNFGRIVEVVGRELSPATLSRITFNWMYCGGHALIVNEAHGLNRVMIEHFLDVLENLKGNVVAIFTTTNDGHDLFEDKGDAGPFASRCLCLNLTSENLTKPFAERAREIAKLEALDGRPLSSYVKLMKKHKNNMRAALSEIEAGVMMEA